MVAPTIMSAVTDSGSIPVTARLASSRYRPQQTPAESASSTPIPVADPEGPARTTTPTPASTIHSQSSLRRVPRTATPSGPDELDGDDDADGHAADRAVEAEVHEEEDQRERRERQAVAPGRQPPERARPDGTRISAANAVRSQSAS